MKKLVTFLVLVFTSTSGFSEDRHVRLLDPGDEASDYTWRPVTLTDNESRLLDTRSTQPKTALDYYLLLPETYFERIDDSLERRITFIDTETLSDQYLHAEYTIPRVDAGAFWITIRLFKKDGESLIALRSRGWNTVHKDVTGEGFRLSHVAVGKPEFWRYGDGEWIPENSDLCPEIKLATILDRYQNHFKAHLNRPDQQKWIALNYDLPRTGASIKVTGREIWMSPRKEYIWAEYAFNGDHFVTGSISKQEKGSEAVVNPR